MNKKKTQKLVEKLWKLILTSLHPDFTKFLQPAAAAFHQLSFQPF